MAQAINEEFNPWNGTISPDGIWRLAGPWYGTGEQRIRPLTRDPYHHLSRADRHGFLEFDDHTEHEPTSGGRDTDCGGVRLWLLRSAHDAFVRVGWCGVILFDRSARLQGA